MKKTYMKPVLFGETFRMAEHIAANCAVGPNVQVTFSKSNQCSYRDGSVLLFADALSGACKGMDYDEDAYTDAQDYLNDMTSQGLLTCYNAFINGKVFAS